MKYFLILLLIFLSTALGKTQVPEFSELSGNKTFYSELTKGNDGYFLYNVYFDTKIQTKIYKITEQGEITDSVNLRDFGRSHIGKIAAIDGKLYFGGVSTDTISDNSQRYNLIEFDGDLNIVREYRSDILDTLISPFYNRQTSDGTNSVLFDFTVFNDTVYAIGDYAQFDTLINPLGADMRYFKANFQGELYQDRPFNGYMHNAFFRGNQMFVQGSNYNPGNPWPPPAVGFYDGDGRFLDGWNFDNSTSGEFPWGACGGIINDKLYFSYLGRDPALPGCPQQTVAIDVRDTAFNIIHRFKVNECEYNYAGDMPFAKGNDGSIYFQAAHQDYKKFMVKKYSPEMTLIWSKEYDFFTNSYFIIPMKLVPTEDGGVIVHCRQKLNGQSFVRLYKISSAGDIISSTTFGAGGTPEPSVLSPNPCKNFIRYTGENTQEMDAEVYSMDGRIAKRISFVNNQIDLSSLTQGLYSVLVFDAKKHQLLHRQTVVKVE